MKYSGIVVDDCVKLINADGNYNKRIKESIDKLAESIESRGHKLLSSYKGNKTEVLIDFKCGHEPRMVTPKDYKKKNGVGCDRCSGHSSEQAREDFFKQLKDKGHILLSEYINNTEEVLIDFKCGHEPSKKTPKAYKLGQECARCNGHSPEQAKEDFFKMLEDNGHELLSDYVNNTHEVLIDFKCGHEPSKKAPKKYKKGIYCVRCNGHSPVQAKEDFFKMLEDNGHELLSDYVNNTHEVLIDFKCGHKPYMRTPKEYKSGRVCPRCGNNSDPKVAKEDFLAILKSNGHRLLSKYIDNTTMVLIDFKCIHKPSTVTPKFYKRGNGLCKKCNLNKDWYKQSEESLKSLLEKVKNNNHKLLSKYIDTNTKVLIDFNCEHNPSWVYPHRYKNGQKCQQCNKVNSRGEIVIKGYLKENKLRFKPQFTFDDLVYKGKLRFDFAVYKDKELYTLIEFDGRQHFTLVDHMGGEDYFKEIQMKDKLKNDYCLENNTRLIRIKYTKFDEIGYILEQELAIDSENSSDVISFYPKVGYYDSSLEEQLDLELV
ncbi:hypothetical protein QRD90_12245 [Peribacillus frigoritolerans]|uniref:DUF2726 domain-containing protein n=1 Tax=Peribacillus simplex TaxID=1478 RepID=A0A8B5Y3C6_9BACI|nr:MULTISPECIES: hypothetical protein [Peribacillus]TVX83309.1 hypothetical protein FQP34_07065 [Peribacillus simplex]WJE49888.1 hypothetical protein QRD90_12245 [Peribacillus frigoritolerans]